jgi:putative ABC transport system permease protein
MNNISKARAAFDQLFPGNIFHWSTLDAKIRGQYSDHEITRAQITSFTVIVIAVACIGILGAMCNNIVRKTKEITIRKIFGADFHQIAAMLLKTTTFQILIAAAVGCTIPWNFAIEYLQHFTEQISLSWWHFVIPLCVLLLIMTSTIFIVMLKAIFLNPVDFLNMNNRGE